MTDELKPCHEAFHDEQMTIWASEIIEALALTDALDFTTYVQKIEAFDVVRRELKVIGEQVAAWNTRPEPSVQEAALSQNDLYYLRAISRRLDEFQSAMDGLDALTIGGEALADERDWLACFIDQHALRAIAEKDTPNDR